METPATAAPAVVPAPPPAAAPVPLTAAPEVAAASAPAEAPRVKRKYTKRAIKAAAPKAKGKRKYTKKAKTMKTKSAGAKAPKKAKRVAGTKAQGQVPKAVLRFLKAEAKEAEATVGSLVGTILTGYATRRGLELDA